MPISLDDIARCKKAFAAFCLTENKKLADITNVVAGQGCLLVCFNGTSLSKAVPLHSNDAGGDMVIWHNHIEPLFASVRRQGLDVTP